MIQMIKLSTNYQTVIQILKIILMLRLHFKKLKSLSDN